MLAEQVLEIKACIVTMINLCPQSSGFCGQSELGLSSGQGWGICSQGLNLGYNYSVERANMCLVKAQSPDQGLTYSKGLGSSSVYEQSQELEWTRRGFNLRSRLEFSLHTGASLWL